MAVQFKPESHQYISTDTDNIPWISVTSLVSQFKQPFDAKKIAEKCSKNKKSKWYGLTPTEIQDAWKAESERATTLGTWYHNQRESDICGLDTIQRDGVEVPVYRPLEGEGGTKLAPDQTLTEGIYPEHLVYLKSAGICGQSDLVEVVNGVVSITDYKTSKEIKMESFTNWEGVKQKMSSPVGHLDDCHKYHYALQLSIYMFIILKHNFNLKPGKLIINHILFEEESRDKFDNPIYKTDSNGEPIVKEVVTYELPYLKSEVISIINWLKINRDKIKKK